MLVDFRVANFRSFREEVAFSLVASSEDRSHPENIISLGDNQLLKTAAIYGPNASGKSNLLKAMRVARDLVSQSATRMNEGDEIPGIAPFRLDSACRTRPTSFVLTVILGETRYEYGFSADRTFIHHEHLFAYPTGGRRQKWLERDRSTSTGGTTWAFRGPLESIAKLLRERTRDNSLALSRAAQENVREIAELFRWFKDRFVFYDLSSPPSRLIRRTAERVKDDKPFEARVLSMLKEADLGIDSLSVSEVESQPVSTRSRPGSEHRTQWRAVVGAELTVQTGHYVADTDTEEQFNMTEDESNGTQRLFALAAPLIDALESGHTLVVDEFECSIHPLMSRRLVEQFQQGNTGPRHGQLVFATQDVLLMDKELLRRDQIWLVEKNAHAASDLYSLYDIQGSDKPRNNEALQKNYLAGRYGGIPRLGGDVIPVEHNMPGAANDEGHGGRRALRRPRSRGDREMVL